MAAWNIYSLLSLCIPHHLLLLLPDRIKSRAHEKDLLNSQLWKILLIPVTETHRQQPPSYPSRRATSACTRLTRLRLPLILQLLLGLPLRIFIRTKFHQEGEGPKETNEQ